MIKIERVSDKGYLMVLAWTAGLERRARLIEYREYQINSILRNSSSFSQ